MQFKIGDYITIDSTVQSARVKGEVSGYTVGTDIETGKSAITTVTLTGITTFSLVKHSKYFSGEIWEITDVNEVTIVD
jgi:hypothetical protein